MVKAHDGWMIQSDFKRSDNHYLFTTKSVANYAKKSLLAPYALPGRFFRPGIKEQEHQPNLEGYETNRAAIDLRFYFRSGYGLRPKRHYYR